MEQNLAILMADLSGYTALTETHGAAAAADLIDKYLEMVQSSLVGSSELKERTGDEVMIVAESADCLLATAALIMQHTSNQENFLQVHGGLHYGTLLKRNNHYFGSAINLTSRIAASATPGSFWCSADFLDALTEPSTFVLQPKGKHRFKNIQGATAIAELPNTRTRDFYIDPVCRMLILDTASAIPHPHKNDLFFCSSTCLHTYQQHQLVN